MILDTDQRSLRLLRLACLGSAAPKAGQTIESIEGAIEHTYPIKSLSALTGPEARPIPAEIQASTTLDTSQTHTAAKDGDESCLSAISPAQATATGAICQIGCLGSLPVTLPASQAALIESQCNIAFSRTAAENLRSQGHHGSSAEYQPKRDSTQNNKQQRYSRNCLWLYIEQVASLPHQSDRRHDFLAGRLQIQSVVETGVRRQSLAIAGFSAWRKPSSWPTPCKP